MNAEELESEKTCRYCGARYLAAVINHSCSKVGLKAAITSLQDENAKLRAPKDGPGGVVEQAATTRPMALQAPSARMNAQDSAGAPPTETHVEAARNMLYRGLGEIRPHGSGSIFDPDVKWLARELASRDRAPAASQGAQVRDKTEDWDMRTPPPPAPPDDLGANDMDLAEKILRDAIPAIGMQVSKQELKTLIHHVAFGLFTARVQTTQRLRASAAENIGETK